MTNLVRLSSLSRKGIADIRLFKPFLIFSIAFYVLSELMFTKCWALNEAVAAGPPLNQLYRTAWSGEEPESLQMIYSNRFVQIVTNSAFATIKIH